MCWESQCTPERRGLTDMHEAPAARLVAWRGEVRREVGESTLSLYGPLHHAQQHAAQLQLLEARGRGGTAPRVVEQERHVVGPPLAGIGDGAAGARRQHQRRRGGRQAPGSGEQRQDGEQS